MPGWVTQFRLTLRSVFRRKQLDQELDEEFQYHLERLIDEGVATGLPPEEAKFAARRAMGAIVKSKEECRDARGTRWLENTLRDLRYALRQMGRNPGFTATAVLTLALGIGANTAIFSIVNALLIRSLPYRDPDKLVYVSEFWPHEPMIAGPPSPDFANWRSQGRLFEDLEAYGSATLNLTGFGDPERIQGTTVTAGFLDLIGVQPTLGRNFTAEEDRLGGAPAAILSYGLWQRRFGSSRDIIGKAVKLDGRSCTIVGVLPASFAFPDNNFHSDVLIPMALPSNANWHDEAHFRILRVLARLKQGISTEALQRELGAIARSTTAEEPPQFVTMRKDMQITVTPLHQRLSGDVRSILLILQATVTIVLLIGCLNVANLQIARSIIRQKEIALRAALGSGRSRLVRQLLTENLLLSSLGGAAGVLLGYWGLPYVVSFLPANLHLLGTARIDQVVLTFTVAVTALTGMLTGLAPILQTTKVDLNTSLKEGTGTLSDASNHRRLRGILVSAEIAAAIILLTGAGLLIRSFLHLTEVNVGFDPHGVLTLRVPLPSTKYAKQGSQITFFSRLLERSQAIPGVQTAAIGDGLPVIGSRASPGVVIEGRPVPPPGGAPTIPLTPASSDYFHALGIPIVRGRVFTEEDGENSPLVIIVNQAFADQFFPGQDALGKHVRFGSVLKSPWREIVGIAGNVWQQGPRTGNFSSMYAPYLQYPDPQTVLILKSGRTPEGLVTEAAAVVHGIDADQPIEDVATMEQHLADSLSRDRANTLLMSIFAGLALLLATLGISGVVAYSVVQRTREIGIRMALGADRLGILASVLRQAMTFTVAGILCGLCGAAMLTRHLQTMLFGISPLDPNTFLAVSVMFIAVALLACYLPARRAMRVDPAVALRHE